MSSGEIRKVPKRQPRQNRDTKIVGAKPIPMDVQEPKTLDQRSKSKPVEITSKAHGEVVTVESHIRRKPRKRDEPEVRLRSMTPEERREWNSVKNLEWEDE